MVIRTLAIGALLLVAAACGNGEDRPGQVSSENSSGSASGSVSASGTGSSSASHAHEERPPAFAESEATTKVSADAADYVFLKLPATVKGPNVYFTVTNTGQKNHEFEVLGADGEPVGEIPEFKPGEVKSLAIKLNPGTYTIQCILEEGGKTHAELGMKTTLAVT